MAQRRKQGKEGLEKNFSYLESVLKVNSLSENVTVILQGLTGLGSYPISTLFPVEP